MAPAEKFGASLPTTSAAKFCDASFTPACSICIVSPPIAFIFEWNSICRTPSPMSIRLASGVRLRTTRGLGDRGSGIGARESGPERPEFRSARRSCLERTELPAEAPAHRLVDVLARVGDLVGDLLRVVERRTQRRAEEGADLVLALVERADPVADAARWSGPPRATAASPAASGGTRASSDRASGSRRRPSCRTRRRPSRRSSRARPSSRRTPAARTTSVRATCARTSTPAMSTVRNVALFGRPIAGPVIASTSSIVNSPDSMARKTCVRP